MSIGEKRLGKGCPLMTFDPALNLRSLVHGDGGCSGQIRRCFGEIGDSFASQRIGDQWGCASACDKCTMFRQLDLHVVFARAHFDFNLPELPDLRPL